MDEALTGPARTARLTPRHVLVAVCAAIVVVAALRSGHSYDSIDVRTYGEMMQGIWLHGLPYIDNGPVDRFGTLQVPWLVQVDGRLWGTYAPLYPYLGAPLLSGGLRLVYVATTALLVPLLLLVHALAREVLVREGPEGERDEWYALAVALGSVFSTPIFGKALELTAYPMVVLFAVAGSLAVVRAVRTAGRARLGWSAGAGVLFALGAASHMLCFPLAAASLASLAILDGTDSRVGGAGWLARTPLHGLWPTRETIASSAVGLVAMIVSLAPVGLLNRLRFGTPSPFSYGPVPWYGSQWGLSDQNLGAHIRFAAPVLGLVFVLPRVPRRTKHQLIALLVPCFAFFVYLAMRANLPSTVK